MARMFSWRSRDAAPAEQKQFPASSAFMVPLGQPVWMRRDYAKFADEGYRRNVIAHRCIAMIATGAASVPWKLSEKKGRGARRVIEQHALLALLDRPNPLQGSTELCDVLFTHRLIAGNAFLHAVGPRGEAPLELHVLRPDRMAIIPGAGGVPKAYRYSIDGRSVDMSVDAVTGNRACFT